MTEQNLPIIIGISTLLIKLVPSLTIRKTRLTDELQNLHNDQNNNFNHIMKISTKFNLEQYIQEQDSLKNFEFAC